MRTVPACKAVVVWLARKRGLFGALSPDNIALDDRLPFISLLVAFLAVISLTSFNARWFQRTIFLADNSIDDEGSGLMLSRLPIFDITLDSKVNYV